MAIILSINAGSSSVKISVYQASQGQTPFQLAELQLTGLTAPPPQLTYIRGGVTVSDDENVDSQIDGQDKAFRFLLKTLTDDAKLPQVSTKDDVSFACHRVVHGGDYATAKVINADTYQHLEQLTDLAPLHNTSALQIVKSCMQQLPRAVNIANFDSQFHVSIPEHICTYPIDPGVAKRNQLRKYGFHGISYQFITTSVARFLGKPPTELNLIALHLGSGASACAIKRGKSWDTSMGLTPLAGLPGATRSGSIDPSLVFHYATDVGRLSPSSTKDIHISLAEDILNKKSGWKALTGTTNFAAIAGSDEPDKRLAYDLFVDRVCGYIGSYYVSLCGQVDALVFAGGIGERSSKLRNSVVEQASCLGFAIDDSLNRTKAESAVQDISKPGAKHRTLVCQTDEQFEMARACSNDTKLWGKQSEDG